MALTDESTGNGFYMPVAPAYGGGYANNGFGMGGDWAWIILLLLAFGGGWGMGGFGGGFGGMWGMDGLYPWLNNSQNINGGFRDQMLQTSIASVGDKITSGFGDVQTQLCGGFAGVNAAIANAAAQGEIAANSRQMASMNQNFALQSALQNCCCENRAGIADLKYTVATENCADRAALSDGIRDILAAQTAGIQSIKDQLCQDKIDAKNDLIGQLRQELLFARGQASQDVQTATIRSGQATTANQLVQELRSCPVPSMPVYGMTPIFSCPQNQGCGCGCNG